MKQHSVTVTKYVQEQGSRPALATQAVGDDGLLWELTMAPRTATGYAGVDAPPSTRTLDKPYRARYAGKSIGYFETAAKAAAAYAQHVCVLESIGKGTLYEAALEAALRLDGVIDSYSGTSDCDLSVDEMLSYCREGCCGQGCDDQGCSKLRSSEQGCCYLACGNMGCGNMGCGDLSCGNQGCSGLSGSDLGCGEQSCGELSCDNLSHGDFSYGDVSCSGLSCGDLSCSDLGCDDLSCGGLSCSDLGCGDLGSDGLGSGDLELLLRL